MFTATRIDVHDCGVGADLPGFIRLWKVVLAVTDLQYIFSFSQSMRHAATRLGSMAQAGVALVLLAAFNYAPGSNQPLTVAEVADQQATSGEQAVWNKRC